MKKDENGQVYREILGEKQVIKWLCKK
jgi:hypothetical protein